jgi:hypothetical protein
MYHCTCTKCITLKCEFPPYLTAIDYHIASSQSVRDADSILHTSAMLSRSMLEQVHPSSNSSATSLKLTAECASDGCRGSRVMCHASGASSEHLKIQFSFPLIWLDRNQNIKPMEHQPSRETQLFGLHPEDIESIVRVPRPLARKKSVSQGVLTSHFSQID